MPAAPLLPQWVAQVLCEQGPGAGKREREFVAGRIAAETALAALNAPTHVGVGQSGEPLWPAGVVGSITHWERHAWCAAARTTDAAAIGIDAEPYMAASRAQCVRNVIACEAELADGIWPSGMDEPSRVTVAFSAKEAFYKCVYPQVRWVFDFLDVAIARVEASGAIALRIETDLSSAWRRGMFVHGRFSADETFVSTAFLLQH